MALANDASEIDSGWIDAQTIEGRCQELVTKVNKFTKQGAEVVVGIDAPRLPLHQLRQWKWHRGTWQHTADQGLRGRHCELVVAAYHLANPQWTPLLDQAQDWMKLGFAIFRCLDGVGEAHEVFPTASYALLCGTDQPQVRICLRNFKQGPKDMLDACVAALTVLEFKQGRGMEVGGGDGYGTIVLPRPVPAGGPSAVLVFPV
jgi:predicted nuclease with RNAse H fold